MTKDKQLKLIQELARIFEELDWLVAIPLENEECRGLIVGEKEFVTDVAKSYYGDQAEIISSHAVEDTVEVDSPEDIEDEEAENDEGKIIH